MPLIEQLPDFYHPANASIWDYRPEVTRLRAQAELWNQRWRLAGRDSSRIELLVIDAQKDFCFSEGALFVAGRSRRGASDDCARLAEFIYHNLARLTHITATLDTHQLFQIFFDSFWCDANGRPPAPFTEISSGDLHEGRYRLTPAAAQFAPPHAGEPYRWAERQALHYVEQLEQAGRTSLTIWPYHSLLGSAGHALSGLIEEALQFHGAARGVQTRVEVKGSHPWSEHYSVFRPEVQSWWDGSPPADKNTALLHYLHQSEALIFAGQASSHCLLWSLDDFISELHGAEALSKIYVLRDCTSPVVVWGPESSPIADFTEASTAAFERWAALGINIVTSTTDMKEWPGLGWLE